MGREPRQMPGLETGPLQGPVRRRSRDHHSSTSGTGPGTRIQPIITSLALHRSPQSPSRRIQFVQVLQLIPNEVSSQPRPRPPPDHSKCETCRGRINRLKSTARHEQWQLRPSRHWRIFAPKSAWSRAVRSFISEALGALLKVRIDHSDSHPGPPFMPLLKSLLMRIRGDWAWCPHHAQTAR